jgi:hypothetical protein
MPIVQEDSMKKIRPRLTFANVISCLALFVALGGSAYAATQLKKNSVGSKQLKKNSVTAAKLRKNAITGAKIANSAVTGAKVANGSLTGANINLGSLGTVPSATNAINATSAKTVNGQAPAKVFKTLLPGESEVVVVSAAGFTLTSSCEKEDSNVTLTSPSSTGSVLAAEGGGIEGSLTEHSIFNYESEEAGKPSVMRLDESDIGAINLGYGETSFSGATSAGAVISGEIGYDYQTFNGEAPARCVVYGQITSG